MKNENEVCGKCKYHQYDNICDLWFCGNPDSEYYTDWTEYKFECNEFEKTER